MNKSKLKKEGLVDVLDLRVDSFSNPCFSWNASGTSDKPKNVHVHFDVFKERVTFGIEDLIAIIFRDENTDSPTYGKVFQEKILVLRIQPDIVSPNRIHIFGLQRESKEIIQEK